jgi:hypothetical protein
VSTVAVTSRESRDAHAVSRASKASRFVSFPQADTA